ncbi:hypothetical protein CR513_20834, partial [Mucuna pruriens]
MAATAYKAKQHCGGGIFYISFLSKVTIGKDGYIGLWKERFIYSQKKVKVNLQRICGNPISYENITYSQIHNIVIDTGNTRFYVMNASKQERGTSKLVIILKWIRYILPNKSDLIKRLHNATIFFKFDMKSSYYQILVVEEDRYKTTFVVPFRHYRWNIMSQGLKKCTK